MADHVKIRSCHSYLFFHLSTGNSSQVQPKLFCVQKVNKHLIYFVRLIYKSKSHPGSWGVVIETSNLLIPNSKPVQSVFFSTWERMTTWQETIWLLESGTLSYKKNWHHRMACFSARGVLPSPNPTWIITTADRCVTVIRCNKSQS